MGGPEGAHAEVKDVNWQKVPPSAYAQVSECGRFSVCRIGFGDGHRFEAWRTRAHPDGPHLIATNLPTSQAARDAAGKDDRD